MDSCGTPQVAVRQVSSMSAYSLFPIEGYEGLRSITRPSYPHPCYLRRKRQTLGNPYYAVHTRTQYSTRKMMTWRVVLNGKPPPSVMRNPPAPGFHAGTYTRHVTQRSLLRSFAPIAAGGEREHCTPVDFAAGKKDKVNSTRRIILPRCHAVEQLI